MIPSSDWVFVGLGGNVGTASEIRRRFDDVCQRLAASASGPIARSPTYRSAPVGRVADQAEFINEVIGFLPAEQLRPRTLLKQLLAIEKIHGRVRAEPGGPRTLDLDLLVFGSQTISEPGLVVPHPRMAHRAFVLQPLLDLLAQPLERLS